MKVDYKEIRVNEELVRRIVYAINKAVTVDIPQELRENSLETNNRIGHMFGDCINDNLRHHVVDDEYYALIAFNRNAWKGRILADHKSKITYTICKEQTLAAARSNKRTCPHYLKSILFIENSEYEGCPKQMTLSDYMPDIIQFSDEEYEQDYDKIMQGEIDKLDGYNHYVITYTTDRMTISTIRLVLLDKDMAEVESVSLLEYVEPDFEALTAPDFNAGEAVEEMEEPEKKTLVKLRPGVVPMPRVMEEEA